MSENTPANKLWTPANIVTVARICGVPLFVVAILSPWPEWLSFWPDALLWKPWLATAVFIVLAATDGLDGYLARSRNEVTNFGKFVDPLADKMLTTAALLALIELGVLPSWPVLIILCREFIVAGIRMVAASEGVVIAASWYGKAKTVTQIVAIVLFLVKESPLLLMAMSAEAYAALYGVAWAVMLAAVVLTIVSMFDYFSKAKELLGFTKRSKRGTGASERGAGERDASRTKAAGKDAGDDGAPGTADESTEDVARRVLSEARSLGRTICTAESLTGGLVAAALTAIPGSSDVVAGGIVSYSCDVKRRLLDVSDARLEETGPVDEQVAVEMARGALKRTGASLAVAVTGIAGPGGAEPGKPVGTVCFAVVDDNIEYSERRVFEGDRDEVRRQTVVFALELLSRMLASPDET